MLRRRIFFILFGYALSAVALICVLYGATTIPNPPVESTRVDLQGRVDSLQVIFYPVLMCLRI